MLRRAGQRLLLLIRHAYESDVARGTALRSRYSKRRPAEHGDGNRMDPRSWVRRIDENAERWLLLIFYIMIVATIAVEVVRRFVLSYSSIWGEEIARYSFIYLAWIGASAGIRERAHIRIDVIYHYIPERVQAAFYLFAEFLTLALACIALYWSLGTVMTSLEFGSVTDGLRISKAWFLAAVPLGFLMMVFRLIQAISRDIAILRHGGEVFRGHKLFD